MLPIQDNMENCIFCKIIKGEIGAFKVYENEDTLAFLDIHPFSSGHLLVVPKIHIDQFFDLPQDKYLKLMEVVRKLSKAVNKSIKPKRIGILVAGWDVPHVHIHIVPMERAGELTSKAIQDDTRGNPSEDELKSVSDKIKESL